MIQLIQSVPAATIAEVKPGTREILVQRFKQILEQWSGLQFVPAGKPFLTMSNPLPQPGEANQA